MDSTTTIKTTEAPHPAHDDLEKGGLSADVEKGGAVSTGSESVIHHDASDEKPDGPDAGKGHPELVDWDGEDDPQNPLNWSGRAKWSAMLTVAAMCFLSPLASTLVAPAAPAIAMEFGVRDASVAALIVSVFVLGFAIGPLFASPLSELYGRTLVLQVFMVLFFIFNLACAVSQSTAQIIIFRFLAGCGGAAPISVGAGTLTDCFRAHERGTAMALFSLGILVGPIVGPVAGAWLVADASWRWAMWLIVIAAGVVSLASFVMLSETYHPTLLARKAKKLHQAELKEWQERVKANPETAGPEPVRRQTVHEARNLGRTASVVIQENLLRPFVLLFTDPICALIGAYMAICYGYLYLMFVTFGNLFTTVYGQSLGVANLNYIAPGIGSLGGTIITAMTMDRIYLALAKKNGGEGKPEYRIPVMFAAAILLPVGLIIYGWTAQYQTHWIAPDIGICIFSAGVIVSFLALNTYIVDAFKYTASAIAATTVLRSFAGAFFPLFGKAMFDALGLGWGNTLLAFIALALGTTYPVFLWYYGPKLRAKNRED